MKKIFISIITLFVHYFCEAQDWSGSTYEYFKPASGYVILASGDTLRGYVLHGDRISSQKNCIFYERKVDEDMIPTDVVQYFEKPSAYDIFKKVRI